MQLLEWINKLLQRHGLEKPDGRPLYQYRVNDQEFSELTKLLKQSTESGVSNIDKVLFWDAVFVMYAAEWWRRCYDGNWGWCEVFGSIDINYEYLRIDERNSLVKAGLHRWGRIVRKVGDKRKFLGTIATEGGLPLNQLKKNRMVKERPSAHVKKAFISWY